MSALSARDVTAIVVSFDSAAVLPQCLDALAREGVAAVVVDNASTDTSREIALAHGAELVALSRNEGYGRGNNAGIAACRTPFALVTNPDIVVGEGTVAALLAAAERYPDAALFAPRIVEPSGRVFLQPRSLLSPPHLNRAKSVVLPEGDACLPFLSGACFLVRVEAFLAIGGFDPEIFLFYEDDDLCRRLRDAGHALVHVDDAQAGHGRGKSTAPSIARRVTARWHLAWSHHYVAAKHGLAGPGLGAMLRDGLKAIGYGLIFQRMKAAAHAGSFAGAWSWRRGRTALGRQGLER